MLKAFSNAPGFAARLAGKRFLYLPCAASSRGLTTWSTWDFYSYTLCGLLLCRWST